MVVREVDTGVEVVVTGLGGVAQDLHIPGIFLRLTFEADIVQSGTQIPSTSFVSLKVTEEAHRPVILSNTVFFPHRGMASQVRVFASSMVFEPHPFMLG